MTALTAPTADRLNALTLGLEFECYLPHGTSMSQGAAAVSSRLGAPCPVIPYNAAHQTITTWKVTTDGSLGDYQRGAEFVSPIISGENGDRQIKTVCDALTDLGATVSKDCGLHVHVGAAGQPLDFFKNLVRIYQAYEGIIDGMMPVSRRRSTNVFCRSLASVSAAAINNAHSVSALAEAIRSASRAGEQRYHKLNLAAFNRHRTVEFRQHSGTTDATKTAMWVSICRKMVLAAQRTDLNFGQAVSSQPLNRARRGTKAHRIGEMLLRAEGVTGREICAEMNWPSVSVPAQARSAGLTVVSQRTGREVRYFAARAEAQTPSALVISINGFADLLSLTDAERAYITERTANLSNNAIAWAA
jgi:hypothetical protein